LSPQLTHLDRVYWPDKGYTKRDLVEYYRAVAPVLLPHVRDRPFTLKRHYTVPRGPFEWVKDAPPELPGSVRRCPQPAKSRGGALVHYAVVDDLDALLWMVELGAVDLHVWPSRCATPQSPDYVVFDLDPAGAGTFADVVDAGLAVRGALETLELESYPRTTGGEGLHVVVPLAPGHTHEEARRFATIVSGALRLERARIDTKMIGHGQQLVAVYSVRPLPGAPVATPLAWDEVTTTLDPRAFDLGTVPRRVAQLGDLHAPVLHGGQRLDRALGLLANEKRPA
jgi:bifunctional non-homologous end joining protein LigD